MIYDLGWRLAIKATALARLYVWLGVGGLLSEYFRLASMAPWSIGNE